MKQTYIKPNTEVQQIELVQMIAQSPGFEGGNVDPGNIESKHGDYLDMRTGSNLWGDSEEEE
ncbi:MAG: hypothetical protein IJ549_03820 [Prevotella sp.]|nr:hypothetical protein [Prevotella sp.]